MTAPSASPVTPEPYSDGFWEAVVAGGFGPEAVARVIQAFAAGQSSAAGQDLAADGAGCVPLSELECAAAMAKARARLDRKSREERAEIRARAANPIAERIAVACRSGWGKSSRATGKVRR